MQKPVIIIGIIFLVAIAAYTIFAIQDQNNVQTSLNWHTDLNSAFEESKKTNAPIFIDFYAPWCSYCKKLDENTFSNPKVQANLNYNYIVVKIDIDKYPDIASKYKVYGVPTMVFLYSNGTEFKRKEGYIGPDEFFNLL